MRGVSGGRKPRVGATPEDCHALRKHGHRAEAQKCYETLTAARDPYLRAEGFWGMEMYQEANNAVSYRGRRIAQGRDDSRALGPLDARAVQ